MEVTEKMKEFMNDLIGERMEQVYWENDGKQYDPFNEKLELKLQKVLRKMPKKQEKMRKPDTPTGAKMWRTF